MTVPPATTRPEWATVRRRLLVLAAVAAALSGACAPDGDDATGSGASAEATGDGAVGVESISTSVAPTTVVASPSTVPLSPACEAAARVVLADVAIATAPDPEASRESLAAALAELTDAPSPLAETAGALAADDPTAAPTRDIIEFDRAMLDACDLRLAKSGLLRPDADPDDALDGLGLTRRLGTTCESAGVLRWADAQWRAAADGGARDRLGVIVRQALGALREADLTDRDVELDLPADIERADLSGRALSADHRIAVVRLDADLRRACDAGLELGGLLMERSVGPSAAALAALPEPGWAEPRAVTADRSHARWCAIADDLYADDAAYVVNEPYELERRDRIGRELRLGLGALRIASRSGGSIATLADVRDTIVATEIVERADFTASGLLTPEERRAVADLDRIIVANCGVGLSPQFGVLGPHVGRFDVTDPDAQPGATTTVAVVDTSTTSTSLPTRMPNAAVAVVGDSLTLGAQLEITATLGGIGLGVVDVDGQVSRRMTSSTDTIRSGLDVVREIAAAASPKIWVIALGTNDVASGSSADSIRDSVERVLAAIPPDALVVWVDTWIRDERAAVVAGNLIIRDVVAQRHGAVVADFFSYGDDPGIVGGDGVHLTAAGRTLFANVLANGIADVLGRNPLFDLGSATTTLAPTATDPVVAPPVATTIAASTTTAPPPTA